MSIVAEPSHTIGARISRGVGKRLSALAFIGIAAAFICAAWIGTQGFIIVKDGMEAKVVSATRGTDAETALERAGVSLGAYDSVRLDGGTVATAAVSRAHEVKILADGEVTRLYTIDETVGELLSRAGVTLSGLDITSSAISEIPNENETISVTRRSIEYTTAKREIPYINVVEESPFLYEGETTVATDGENGEQTLTYASVMTDGHVTNTYLMSEKTTKEVVNEVTLEGTKEKPAPVVTTTKSQTYMSGSTSAKSGASTSGQSTASSYEGGGGTVTTHSGNSLSYSRVLQCTATAYFEPVETRITAMGTTPEWGVIAVDPRVIPLGTSVYITNLSGTWEYGVSSAEDTGGAIKGNKVDLFMESLEQCYSYGRGQVLVYVLS